MRIKGASLMDSAPVTPSGDTEHTVFSPHLLANGSIELLPIAKVNIKDEINSHADECDLSLILNKLENGDLSALYRSPAVFGDSTCVPSNLREFLDVGLAASRAFDVLPHELRSKFNSIQEWVASGAPCELPQPDDSSVPSEGGDS